MKKIIETLIFILLIIYSNQVNAQGSESTLMSPEGYLKSLLSFESTGGTLYCPDIEGEKHHKFNSCKDFMLLQNQGCFGYATPEIAVELRYKETCDEIEAVKQVRPVNVNYFNLNSQDWWKLLPAEIVPMPGGIYTDDSWSQEKSELDKLVSGKLLGELKFKNVVAKNGEVELTLNSSKEDCGEIHDKLKFSARVLADFDNDGIAELLIKGYRIYESESCWLGTGNSLGAGFTSLLKKSNLTDKIVILPYPAK
jgi:hypothetical protein